VVESYTIDTTLQEIKANTYKRWLNGIYKTITIK
jgi:hypothetical protein